jgi:hypothetical protein
MHQPASFLPATHRPARLGRNVRDKLPCHTFIPTRVQLELRRPQRAIGIRCGLGQIRRVGCGEDSACRVVAQRLGQLEQVRLVRQPNPQLSILHVSLTDMTDTVLPHLDLGDLGPRKAVVGRAVYREIRLSGPIVILPRAQQRPLRLLSALVATPTNPHHSARRVART